jgi:(1->4)-alpha-D-glucan 1-alpha-D-glucosylmutase
VPVSTYRVQLRAEFGFDEAAAIVPYLADLGVTHLYCSPWLQAAPGSAHGYDVIDHGRVSDELGGPEAHTRLVAACRAAGLGIVLDIVPNHMAVSEPQSQNAAWWSFLRDGPASAYASWFDVDGTVGGGRVLVPVLGAPLVECLPDLVLEADRVRYFDHELPLALGTLVPDDVHATLVRQHYRVASWRVASEELNVRRFFDVTSLAGIRVEDEAVFDATHRVIVEQVRSGVVDGLRVDHPDGLADPAGYLDRLAQRTDDAWVAVEKILEPGEDLPASWRCAGTTGYDALNRVLGLFVDPAGEQALTALWDARSGSSATYDDVVGRAKRQVVDSVLAAEVHRLVRAAQRALVGHDVTDRALRDGLVELLVAFPVYRAYVPERSAVGLLGEVVAAAQAARPDLHREIGLLAGLAVEPGEFATRFQQTCGPVMAKGVEDTAFYRYLRLTALNEVGGDPGRFGVSLAEFHAANEAAQRDWPLTMTALSTHDTKRSEDVRARLALLSQQPVAWGEHVIRWSAAAHGHLDGGTEQLVWQTLVGAWPISADRAVAYVEKATREAKLHTSWTDPDAAYDDRVQAFVRGVLADRDLTAQLGAYVDELGPAWELTLLAQKLIQLTLPGVADTYQGTELIDLSLVDPDNRRPVDYDRRRRALADLDTAPPKLRVTATALRLRRAHPEWFLDGASYAPLDAGPRAVAFVRSDRVTTVAPIRAVDVLRRGWRGDAVTLPEGPWADQFTGAERSGTVPLAELLADFPVALLVRA